MPKSSRFSVGAQAPGLYFTPKEWSRLKDMLADPFFEALYRHCHATLDEIRRWREEEPDRRMHHRLAKTIVQHGAVVWHVEHDRRYLDFALQALDEVCRQEWSPTHSHGIREADLRTGELMYVVAFAFDAFHSELSAEQRRRCVELLIDNGIARYHRGIAAKDWWYNCDFNWNSALHGNAGVAALAVRDHAPAVTKKTLAAAREGLQYMIDAYYPGGGWTEGLMYFGTATCHLIDFVYALNKTMGDDLGVPKNRTIQDTIDFVLRMHGGDGEGYNFSDCSNEPNGWARPHTFWMAQRCARPDWAGNQEAVMRARFAEGRRHGRGINLFTDIDAFWYRRPHQKGRRKHLRGLHHFQGIDWVTWRGSRTWLAFRGGYNAGNHNNLDLGHFIFGVDDTRFLIDPGYGAKTADQHNCPIMRFRDQTEGATAPVLRCDKIPGGFYLVCALQEAFPHVLEHYDRHLAVLDDRHLVIVDDIRGKGTIRNDAQYNLQTRLPAEVTAEGFAIQGPRAKLRVVVGDDTKGCEVEEWEMRRSTVARLKWYDDYFHVHSIRPTVCTTSRAKVTFRKSDDRVRVTVGKSSCVFTLRHAWSGGRPPGLA